MKILFALGVLCAVCAAAELEPVELPEPAVPYVGEPGDKVHVVDSPDQGYVPDDNLRVNVVDIPDWGYIPEDNLRVNVVDAPEYNAEENVDGYQPIAPSELESLRVDFPQDPYDEFRRDWDPMWR